MATKREVMLAGTPAKLAHMLASDAPQVLAASGVDQGSANLVETNFQVLYGGEGGVRLRPATGQWLHFLFNGNWYTVAVYPDTNEWINDMPPGEPFLLEAYMTGVFAPARRQWIGGTLAGSPAGAATNEVTGPLGIGVTPPANADAPQLFVERLVLAWSPGAGPSLGTRVYFNAYADATHTPYYLQDGPAYMLRCDHDSQNLQLWSAVPGTAGSQVTFTLNAQFGSPGVLGVGSLQPPVNAGASQIFADRLALRWSPGAGGALGARIFFNYYLDPNNQAFYQDNGAVGSLRLNATTNAFEFDLGPPGTAGASVGTNVAVAGIAPASAVAAGQTNFSLVVNNAGTITMQTVLVGPANSGPGGAGRALYVPN